MATSEVNIAVVKEVGPRREVMKKRFRRVCRVRAEREGASIVIKWVSDSC